MKNLFVRRRRSDVRRAAMRDKFGTAKSRISDRHLQPLSSGPGLQELKWFPRSNPIRAAASLNNGPPFRIDFNGQHMVNFVTPPRPERPDARHPAATPVSIAANTMV